MAVTASTSGYMAGADVARSTPSLPAADTMVMPAKRHACDLPARWGRAPLLPSARQHGRQPDNPRSFLAKPRLCQGPLQP
jgi:hypothetical protein